MQGNGLNGPVGITMDEAENIYVANYNGGRVFMIDDNQTMTALDSVPDDVGYITYTNGMVYATGISTNRIYRIPADGGNTTKLEGSSAAGFLFPNGITANNDGSKLFVSNFESNKIILIENFESQSSIPTLPQAQNDSATVEINSEAVIDVLSNDCITEGDIDLASIDIITLAQNGNTTVNNAIGEISYTPVTGFSGTDSFVYTVNNTNGDTSNEATVSITITDPTIAPQAQNDNVTVSEGSTVVINILANDSTQGIPEPESVDIVILSQNGSTSVNDANGAVTYTPAAGFSGTDSFVYTVANVNGDTSNQATVSVTITTAPITPPAPPTPSSGGGSFGISLFLMLLLISIRRHLLVGQKSVVN